jgi:hypothetical protein
MMYSLDGIEFETIGDFMEAYFERAAVKLLGHTEAKPAYFINTETSDVSDIETAIANGIKLPALILDAFDDTIQNRSDSVRTRLTAAITVIATYDQGNAKDLRKVRNQCRDIGRKIVMQMHRDNMMPLSGVLIKQKIHLEKEEVNGMYIGPMRGIFTGWAYEFAWYLPDNLMYGSEDWS